MSVSSPKSKKRGTRHSFTRALSKKWNTTKHKIEKELDFFLMECKLNILIPSDNSIEMIFFFVKEIDISEEDNLNFPLDSDESSKNSQDKQLDGSKETNQISLIPISLRYDANKEKDAKYDINKSNDFGNENIEESQTFINLDDIPNLDEKLSDFKPIRSIIMPPKPKDFIYEEKNKKLTELKIEIDNAENENNEYLYEDLGSGSIHGSYNLTHLSPGKNKTNRSSGSKPVETYKSYLTKRMESHKSDGKKIVESDQKSKMKTNSERKFQYLDLLRKNNQILVDHDMKSEQNSTTSSSMALSKKFLKNTINICYIPPCFTYLKYGLMMSIFLIYISQIINTVFVVTTYKTLRQSFYNDMTYERLGPLILRTLNTSYKLVLMEFGVLSIDPNDMSQNFDNLNQLLLDDSSKIMSSVEYLNDNKPEFTIISQDLYLTTNIFYLSENKTLEMKFTDALIFYVSKIMSFANKHSYDLRSEEFYFIIKNYQTLLNMINLNNHFTSFNQEEIYSLEIECLCLVFIALSIVMIFMIYRIKYYRSSYQYINKIFNMLVHISFEDLNILKNYMNEAVLFFKNDKQSKHLITNKQSKAGSLNYIHNVKENSKDKDNKRTRKTKSCQIIALPLKRLMPFNLILYLIILGGYLALLSFSNIFNKDLSNKVLLKDVITPKEYVNLANSLTFMYDSFASSKMGFSYFNYQENFLLDYYHGISGQNILSQLGGYLSEDYYNQCFNLYQNENICSSLFSENSIKYNNFIGKNYFDFNNLNENMCSDLLDRALTQGR